MARYRKVDCRVWNDEKFRVLSDDAKLVWLFLLTHPYMTPIGGMRATIPGLASELGWTERRFRKAFQEAFRKGMPNQEQEQEQEQEHISPPSPSFCSMGDEAKASNGLSPERLIALYDEETAEELPAVEKITPARLKKAREYLRLFPDEDFWHRVFAETHRSRFLQGLAPQDGRSSPFKASFDWLLSKGKDGIENCAKTYEGRYRDGD